MSIDVWMQSIFLQEGWPVHMGPGLWSGCGSLLIQKRDGLARLDRIQDQSEGRLVIAWTLSGSLPDSIPCSADLKDSCCTMHLELQRFDLSMCRQDFVNQQERKERRKKFLDRAIEPMTIDDAMAAMLEAGGKQFKNNVQLYGAVHTDELR